MRSNRCSSRLTLALALAAPAYGAWPPSEAGAQSLVCPSSISVTESANVEGWNSQAAGAQHPFERISVFNRDSKQDYDLAPDSEQHSGNKLVQTWNLKDYRTMPLFLSCRYRDTSLTLTRELPAPLTTCTFTFQLDKNGGIVAPTMACKGR